MNKNLKDLVCLDLSSLLDPQVSFRPEHKKNIRIVSNALEKSKREINKISKPILRNSFLYGCREYTREEPVEHLVIGFGQRRGRSTDILSLLHLVGDFGDDLLPREVFRLMDEHLAAEEASNIAIFRYFPSCRISTVTPAVPNPSPAEKRFIVKANFFHPFPFLKYVPGAGRIDFFGAEHGVVKSISWPEQGEIDDFIRKVKEEADHD